MTTLSLQLTTITSSTVGQWTHSASVDNFDELSGVVAVCQLHIFKHFLFLEKDYYITLSHYKEYEGRPTLQYENQFLKYKRNRYRLDSAVRIRISHVYYKKPQDIKDYILYCVRHVSRDTY